MSETSSRPGNVSPRIQPLPRCTAHAARRAAPAPGYLELGDTLGLVLADIDLGRLYPDRRPPLRPELLAVAAALQHVERLSDEAAAAAIADRVEWRYALHQPLDSPAPSGSDLAEFRRRLAADEAALRAVAVLLRRLHMIGVLRREVSADDLARRRPRHHA